MNGQGERQRIARMIGLKQAAEETGLAYGRLRLMCINKEIPHIKAGKKFLLNADILGRYLCGETGGGFNEYQADNA